MKKRSGYLFIFSFAILSMGVEVYGEGKGKVNSFPDSALPAVAEPSPPIVRGFTIEESFSPKDCNDAKSWGANVIRVHTFPARFASRAGKEFWDAWPDYLIFLEKQVRVAQNAGIKVIIDLHEPPFQNVESFDHAEFWNRTDLEGPFCKVWTDIARRLLPLRETIWGYDILNEPLDRTQLPSVAKQWRPLAIKIIESIRKVDQDTWIIFEPGPGGLFTGFKGLQPIPDKRIIYSAHFYTPQDFTHQGVFNIEGTDLATAMEKINQPYPSEERGWNKEKLENTLKEADEFQAKWNVPIYVGEFSVIRWAPKQAGINWLSDVVGMFEKRGWSWCYHAFHWFNGWSLDHDEQFWRQGMPTPKAVNYETERGAIIRSAFSKNGK